MSDENARRFIGTWKLISAVREEHPSGEKVDQFGPGAIGFLSYGADGRMLAETGGLAIVLDGPRLTSVAESQGEHGWWRGERR